jgi:hypothetical protein
MSGSARRTGWASGWDKVRLARWRPHTPEMFSVSESDILCKQFLTYRDGLVFALRQRYVRPQQGYQELRAAGEAGHPAQVHS